MLDAILGGIGKIGDWISNSNEKDNDRALQREIAEKNIANQREFAQQGIRWKVEDAKAAGLHPLAALGAQGISFSPISVGSTGDHSSSAFGDMGQSLGRAIDAKTTDGERASTVAPAMARVAQTFQLERLNLENEVLKTDIALKRAQLPPPMPGRVPLPTPGPNRSVDGMPLPEDDMKQKPGDAPSQAFSRPFGYKLVHNPYFSDGQVYEDRYGDNEAGSILKWVANMIGDHYYTFGPDTRAAGWDPKYGRSSSPTRDWFRR